jgi:hypothetical protein
VAQSSYDVKDIHRRLCHYLCSFHVSAFSKLVSLTSKETDKRSSVDNSADKNGADVVGLRYAASNVKRDSLSNAGAQRRAETTLRYAASNVKGDSLSNAGAQRRAETDPVHSEEKTRKDSERSRLKWETIEKRGQQARGPEGKRNTSNISSATANDALKSENQLQAAAIGELQDLIDRGLVVPRWSGEKEEPIVPGGPGE